MTRRPKPRDWKEQGEKFRVYIEGTKKRGLQVSVNIYLNKNCHSIRNTVTTRPKPRDWKEQEQKFRVDIEGTKKRGQVLTYILINIATL